MESMEMMGLALNLICIVQKKAVIEKHIWYLMNAVDVADCHPFSRIYYFNFALRHIWVNRCGLD